MKNGIFIIAHAPLASALRQCVGHVFPDRMKDVLALDVKAEDPMEQSLALAMRAMQPWGQTPMLLLTDVMGATPCNVAQRLLSQITARVIVGVNLPMLLRAVTYQNEPLDELMDRALLGGVQGVLQATAT